MSTVRLGSLAKAKPIRALERLSNLRKAWVLQFLCLLSAFESSRRIAMQQLKCSYVQRVEHGVQLLPGKWTMRIHCSMRDNAIRPGELRRLHPLASTKALAATLRCLEGAGMIVRRDLSTSVLHVEYELKETARLRLSALLDCVAELAPRP